MPSSGRRPRVEARSGASPARLSRVASRHPVSECVPLSTLPPDLRLEAVLESISDAFYAVSPEWTYVIFNGAAEQYFGVTRDQVLGKNMWEVFPQGIGTPFETVCKRAMDGRKGAAFESPSRWRPDRWVEIRITPMIDGGIGVSLHDITERRRAEQARELLAREVDHRSRNALAVVQAIVRLTEGPDLESYKEAVFGRVNALARAQGALADRRWEGAPLRELVDEAMAALSGPDRYSLEGPTVRLRPEQTQPLSMLIHELATNAAKYGGLSTPEGRVAIAWTHGEDGAIDLSWRESGGPPAAEPLKPGFGTRLMTQLSRQMAAKLSPTWAPSGLAVSLAIPAPQAATAKD